MRHRLLTLANFHWFFSALSGEVGALGWSPSEDYSGTSTERGDILGGVDTADY